MARVLGNVNAVGQPVDGTSGFSVAAATSGQTGAWVVTFDQPFTATPTLLVTLVNSEWNMTYRNRPRPDGFDMETFRNDGTPAAASFDFGAWGDR
ncbi:MAG: hypothetical protein AAF657_11795 [Acidobacteriota bacterium]